MTNTQMQIFSLQIEQSLEEVFPPNIIFGGVLDPTSHSDFLHRIRENLFPVPGATMPRTSILAFKRGFSVYSIDGNTGRLTGLQVVPFQAGGTAVNNPAKILVPPTGAFVYAIDNFQQPDYYLHQGGGWYSDAGGSDPPRSATPGVPPSTGPASLCMCAAEPPVRWALTVSKRTEV